MLNRRVRRGPSSMAIAVISISAIEGELVGVAVAAGMGRTDEVVQAVADDGFRRWLFRLF